MSTESGVMESMVFFEGGSPVIDRLAHELTYARRQHKRFRIITGRSKTSDGWRNWLKYKIGEGMWSEPIWEDEGDPTRDNNH